MSVEGKLMDLNRKAYRLIRGAASNPDDASLVGIALDLLTRYPSYIGRDLADLVYSVLAYYAANAACREGIVPRGECDEVTEVMLSNVVQEAGAVAADTVQCCDGRLLVIGMGVVPGEVLDLAKRLTEQGFVVHIEDNELFVAARNDVYVIVRHVGGRYALTSPLCRTRTPECNRAYNTLVEAVRAAASLIESAVVHA